MRVFSQTFSSLQAWDRKITESDTVYLHCAIYIAKEKDVKGE